MRKLMIACFAAVAVAVAAEAKTTTWTAAGGGNFNNADNWDSGIPAEKDTVNLVATGTGFVWTNDIEGLVLSTIKMTNPNSTTTSSKLTGKPLTVASIATAHPATIENDIRATGNLTVSAVNAAGAADNKRIDIKGSVDIEGSYLYAGQSLYFYGPVTATNAQLNTSGNGYASFENRVAFKSVYGGKYWSGATFVFDAAPVDIKEVSIGAATYTFYKADPLPADTVLTWDFAQYIKNSAGAANGVYEFKQNATIDRIDCPVPPYYANGNYINIMRVAGSSTGGNSTLTLRASADSVSYAALELGLSLVYDPLDDWTMTLSNRVHSMTGSISVKGGTFLVAGDTTLAQAKGVKVEGGAFVLDSNGANALKGLKTLDVVEGATFEVTERADATALSTVDMVTLGYGVKLALPEQVAFTATRLFSNGVAPDPGTYTGVGHAAEGVTECDWIDGAGRVTVVNTGLTCWKAAMSGDWGDAANWTAGLPDVEREAYVTVGGADYTVTVKTGDLMPYDLTIRNLKGTATFRAEDAVFSNAFVRIFKGAKVEVPSGGRLYYYGKKPDGKARFSASVTPGADNCMVRIEDGGELLVSGGAATFDAYTGYFGVGGWTAGSTGFLRATSGTVTFNGDNALNRVVVGDGGRVEFSGTSVFSTGKMAPFIGPNLSGRGIVRFSGSAQLSGTGLTYFTTQGGLRFILESDGLYASEQTGLRIGVSHNWGYSYDATQTQDVTVDLTNSTVKVGDGSTTIGGGRPDGSIYGVTDITGRFNVRSGGVFVMSGETSHSSGLYLGGLTIGYGAASYFNTLKQLVGELNVHAGGSVTNQKGHTAIGVAKATGGKLLIDGGEMVCAAKDRLFCLGVSGSTGTCEIRGGKLEVGSDAYVGGAWTNVFPQGRYLYTWGWDPNNHEAVGTFLQSGGDVAFGKRVMLGVDGTGSLEQIGSAGSFAVKELVFSNSVYNASAGGTAKFTLDANGARKIRATDRIVIGANAKLVVDTADYPVDGRGITLFSCPGGIEGEFADVTLTGAFADKTRLVYGPTSIRLPGTRGLALIVR